MDEKIDFLKQVLEIYSPSGEEQTLAEFLCSKMQQLGFNSWIDEAGNVIGETGGNRPILLFIPHIDTVPGYLEVTERDGIITGRGAVDTKSSLVAMILAASYFVDKEINGKIKIIGVVQEETDSKGTQYLLEKGIDADYIVIGEPSGAGGITFAYKGRLDIQIFVQTETGHTGACWQYKNAIEISFKLWSSIVESIERYEEGSYFNSVIPCLTFIKGGQFENIVPNECQMRFDVRYPPKYKPQELFSEIKSCIERFKDQNKVKIELNLISASEAIETDKRSDLMKAFKKAIRQVLEKHPQLIRKTGSSDMHLFKSILPRIPIVAYGPGDSKLDHSPNENIEIDEFLLSIEVLKGVISNILSFY
ncbi:MAG: M20/M25/M40 family metallo-hydrolase [Promethearchaeota archaeon]